MPKVIPAHVARQDTSLHIHSPASEEQDGTATGDGIRQGTASLRHVRSHLTENHLGRPPQSGKGIPANITQGTSNQRRVGALWNKETLIQEAGRPPKNDRFFGLIKMSQKYKAVNRELDGYHEMLQSGKNCTTRGVKDQLGRITQAIETYNAAHRGNKVSTAMSELQVQVQARIQGIDDIEKTLQQSGGLIEPFNRAEADEIREHLLETRECRENLEGFIDTFGLNCTDVKERIAALGVCESKLTAALTSKVNTEILRSIEINHPNSGSPEELKEFYTGELARLESIQSKQCSQTEVTGETRQAVSACIEQLTRINGAIDQVIDRFADLAGVRDGRTTALENLQMAGSSSCYAEKTKRERQFGEFCGALDLIEEKFTETETFMAGDFPRVLGELLNEARVELQEIETQLTERYNQFVIIETGKPIPGSADNIISHYEYICHFRDANASGGSVTPSPASSVSDAHINQDQEPAAKKITSRPLAGRMGEATLEKINESIASTEAKIESLKKPVQDRVQRLADESGQFRQSDLGVTQIGKGLELNDQIIRYRNSLQKISADFFGGSCHRLQESSDHLRQSLENSIAHQLEVLAEPSSPEVPSGGESISANTVIPERLVSLVQLRTLCSGAEHFESALSARLDEATTSCMNTHRADILNKLTDAVESEQLSSMASLPRASMLLTFFEEAHNTGVSSNTELLVEIAKKAIGSVKETTAEVRQAVEPGQHSEQERNNVREQATRKLATVSGQIERLRLALGNQPEGASLSDEFTNLRSELNSLERSLDNLRLGIVKLSFPENSGLMAVVEGASGMHSAHSSALASMVTRGEAEQALLKLYSFGAFELPGFASKLSERIVESRSLPLLLDLAAGKPAVIDEMLNDPQWDDVALRLKLDARGNDSSVGEKEIRVAQTRLEHEIHVAKRTLDRVFRAANPMWSQKKQTLNAGIGNPLGFQGFEFDRRTVSALCNANKNNALGLQKFDLLLSRIVLLEAMGKPEWQSDNDASKAEVVALLRIIRGDERQQAQTDEQIIAQAGHGISYQSSADLLEQAQIISDFAKNIAGKSELLKNALARFDSLQGNSRPAAAQLVSRVTAWAIAGSGQGNDFEGQTLYQKTWLTAIQKKDSTVLNKLQRRFARLDRFEKGGSLDEGSFRELARVLVKQEGESSNGLMRYFFGITGSNYKNDPGALSYSTLQVANISNLGKLLNEDAIKANAEQLISVLDEASRSTNQAFPKNEVERLVQSLIAELPSSYVFRDSCDHCGMLLRALRNSLGSGPEEISRAGQRVKALFELGLKSERISQVVHEGKKVKALKEKSYREICHSEVSKVKRDAPDLAWIAHAVLLDVFAESSLSTLSEFRRALDKDTVDSGGRNHLLEQLEERLAAVGMGNMGQTNTGVTTGGSSQFVSYLKASMDSYENADELITDFGEKSLWGTDLPMVEESMESARGAARDAIGQLQMTQDFQLETRLHDMPPGKVFEISVNSEGGLTMSAPVVAPGVNATFGFSVAKNESIQVRREDENTFVLVIKGRTGVGASGGLKAGLSSLGAQAAVHGSLGGQVASGLRMDFDAGDGTAAQSIGKFIGSLCNDNPPADLLESSGASRIFHLDSNGASMQMGGNFNVNATLPGDLLEASASLAAQAGGSYTVTDVANSFMHRQTIRSSYEISAQAAANLKQGETDIGAEVRGATAASQQNSLTGISNLKAARKQSTDDRELDELNAEADLTGATSADQHGRSLVSAALNYQVAHEKVMVTRNGVLTTETSQRMSVAMNREVDSAWSSMQKSANFDAMMERLNLFKEREDLRDHAEFKEGLARMRNHVGSPEITLHRALREDVVISIAAARQRGDSAAVARLVSAPASYRITHLEFLVAGDQATAVGVSTIQIRNDRAENLESIQENSETAADVIDSAANFLADAAVEIVGEVGVSVSGSYTRSASVGDSRRFRLDVPAAL
jgi:hypothetical protein